MGKFLPQILIFNGAERRWKLSRPLRRLGYSQVYHIILKGIDSQDIFYDNLDRNFFLKQISITKKNFNYLVFAYCLMTNHVHMVIKCKNDLLSKAIQSLVIRYVHYFNKKYTYYILFYYANAAVIIAIEYTSAALHPRDKSLIGALSPSKIGP